MKTTKADWVNGERLVFESPSSGKRNRVIRFIAQMKLHPGKWAVYTRTGTDNMASSYNKLYPALEWASVKNGSGHVIYARYIPKRGKARAAALAAAEGPQE